MNKFIYFGIVLTILTSCKTTALATKTEEITTNVPAKPYFKSSGNEPFWSISISDDKIVYKTPEDSVVMPHIEPILAMDSNVKLYKAKTESAEFNIQIAQQECTNDMSGEVLPYKVTVEYRKDKKSEFKKLNGCGQYITDYRLHDIWVLEELNGNTISKEDFSTEFPMMEINATTNKFTGFSGCNRNSGSIFFEKGKLRFLNIATTKMLCPDSKKETEFLTAFMGAITYSIGNNRLILSNPSGTKLVFKKVD